MKIYINSELIDVHLENEKTLSEIFIQLEEIIKKNNKYILSCFVNNEELNFTDFKDMPIEQVERFDLVSGNEMDLLSKSLEELGIYIDRIIFNLEKKENNEKEEENLTEGFQWILDIFYYATKIFKIQISSFYVFGYEYSLEQLLGELERQKKSSIDQFCKNLVYLKLFQEELNSRLFLMNLTLEELRNILLSFFDFIPAFNKELEKVNENLQSGKDGVAIHLFNHSVSRLNFLLNALISIERNFPSLKINEICLENLSFKQFSKQINVLLKSIADAFEKKDIIEAGDLIEYELTENIELIGKYLLRIDKKIKNYSQSSIS